MPVPTEALGRCTEPVTVEADREWLSCYAASLGAPWSRWLADEPGPGGGSQESHPLFPVAPEWPVVLGANALIPELTADEVVRGVHASHRLELGRPVRAGEAITTTATVAGVAEAPSGARLVVALDTVSAVDGERLAHTEMGMTYLGVVVTGSGGGPGGVGAGFVPRVGVDPEGDVVAAYVVRNLDEGVAYAYSACSRIWNPIHTDPAVAAAAGLPGPIVHGTALLGMAVSAALGALEGGPGAWWVRGLTARFVGMVVPPAAVRLVVTRPRAGGPFTFEVRSEGAEGRADVAVCGTLTTEPR